MVELPPLPAVATASPEEAAPVADPGREQAAALVNAWLVANIHNSALSRNSEAWNCLHAALPALIDSLAASRA